MGTPGANTWREITTQGESWRGAYDATVERRAELVELVSAGDSQSASMDKDAYRRIIFIGCGSTHYLAQFAAPYFQQTTGIPCRGVPSSELAFLTDTLVAPSDRPLVIAFSRSGETSETIMAVERLRASGSQALAITCYGDSPLAKICSDTIPIPEGREVSFAQTRSFSGMLVAVQALAALVGDDDQLIGELEMLPDRAASLMRRAEPLAERIGGDESIKRITYLGSGALYGLASEATVKMKEMSLSLAEPYRFMEFRHGPMALVDEEHLVVALLSDSMRDYELGVLRDVQERGGRIVAIAEDSDGLDPEWMGSLALGSGLSPRARPVLYLPVVQLMGYYRSMGRALNPDRPRHVVMAIRLDGTEMK